MSKLADSNSQEKGELLQFKQELDNEKNALAEQLKNMEEYLGGVHKELADSQQSREQAEKQREELEEKVEEFRVQSDQYKNESEQLAQENSRIKLQVEELAKQCEELRNQNNELKAELFTLNEANQSYSSELEKLNDALSVIEAASSGDTQELETRMNELTTAKQSLAEEVKKLNKALEDAGECLIKEESKRGEVEKDRDTLADELGSAKEELSEMEHKIEELNNEIDKYKDVIRRKDVELQEGQLQRVVSPEHQTGTGLPEGFFDEQEQTDPQVKIQQLESKLKDVIEEKQQAEQIKDQFTIKEQELQSRITELEQSLNSQQPGISDPDQGSEKNVQQGELAEKAQKIQALESDLETLQTQNNQLKNSLVENLEKINELEAEVQSLRNTGPDSNRLTQLQQEVQALKTDNERIENELAKKVEAELEAMASISGLQEQLVGKIEEERRLNEEKMILEKELEERKAAEQQWTKEREDLKQRLGTPQRKEEESASRGQDAAEREAFELRLQEEKDAYDEKEKEVIQLNEQLAHIQEAFVEKEEELVKLTEQMDDMRLMMEEQQKLLEEKHQKVEELSSLTEALAARDQQIEELEKQVQEAVMAKNFAEKMRELDNRGAPGDKKAQELEKMLDKKEQAIQQKNKEIEELRKQLAELRKDTAGGHTQAEQLASKIEALDQQLTDSNKQLTDKEQEIEALLLKAETEQRNTAALQDALAKNQRHIEELRAKHRDELRRVTSERPLAAQAQSPHLQKSREGQVPQEDLEQMKSELERKQSEKIGDMRANFQSELQDAVQHVRNEFMKSHYKYTGKLKQDHQREVERLLAQTAGDESFSEQSSNLLSILDESEKLEKALLGHLTKSVGRMPQLPGTFEALLNNLQSEADNIESLIDVLPSLKEKYNAEEVSRLQTAWQGEKQALLDAVQALKDLLVQAEQSAAAEKYETEQDWRNQLLKAVQKVFEKERQTLSAGVEASQILYGSPPASPVRAMQQKVLQQEKFHSQAMEDLRRMDRDSLLAEINQLRKLLDSTRKQQSKQADTLRQEVKSLREQAESRENDLEAQLESRNQLINQDKEALKSLKEALESERSKVLDMANQLNKERSSVNSLQDAVNREKTRVQDVSNTLEKERIQSSSVKASLQAEKLRSSSMSQALDMERANSQKLRESLDSERKRIKDVSAREHKNMEDLRDDLLKEKQDKTRLERELEKQKISVMTLESELEAQRAAHADALDNEREAIYSVRDELNQERTKIQELLQSLESERRMSSELGQNMQHMRETEHKCKELGRQVKDLKAQLDAENTRCTQYETALQNERNAVQKLNKSLQSEKQKTDEVLRTERMVAKQLKGALDAVQKQLMEQANAMEEERQRVRKLQNERDVQQASTLASKEREKYLETQMEKDKEKRKQLEKKRLEDQENYSRKVKELEDEVQNKLNHIEELKHQLDEKKEQDNKKVQDAEDKQAASRVRNLLLQQQLQSLSQQHNMLIHKHKEQLASNKKTAGSGEVEELQSELCDLIKELEHIQAILSQLVDEDPSVALSPIKAAAYERMMRQNNELTGYLSKITQEKAELRATMANLEEQVAQYRNKEKALENESRVAHQDADSRLAAERTMWAQEKSRTQKALAEMQEDLVRTRDEARQLRDNQERLQQQLATAEHSPTTSAGTETGWSQAKIQKLYGRYIRAESFRKALVYQKKYLIHLLGGFQDCEATTLAMIARMGVYPSEMQDDSMPRRGLRRFRTAARAVVATQRMKFLMNKWKKIRDGTLTSKSSKQSRRGEPAPDPSLTNGDVTVRMPPPDTRDSSLRSDLVPGYTYTYSHTLADRYGPTTGQERARPDRRAREPRERPAGSGDDPLPGRTRDIALEEILRPIHPPALSTLGRSSQEPKQADTQPLSQRRTQRESQGSRPPRIQPPEPPASTSPSSDSYSRDTHSPPVRDNERLSRNLHPIPQRVPPRSAIPPSSPRGYETYSREKQGPASPEHERSLTNYINRLESLQQRLAETSNGISGRPYPTSLRRY